MPALLRHHLLLPRADVDTLQGLAPHVLQVGAPHDDDARPTRHAAVLVDASVYGFQAWLRVHLEPLQLHQVDDPHVGEDVGLLVLASDHY